MPHPCSQYREKMMPSQDQRAQIRADFLAQVRTGVSMHNMGVIAMHARQGAVCEVSLFGEPVPPSLVPVPAVPKTDPKRPREPHPSRRHVHDDDPHPRQSFAQRVRRRKAHGPQQKLEERMAGGGGEGGKGVVAVFRPLLLMLS